MNSQRMRDSIRARRLRPRLWRAQQDIDLGGGRRIAPEDVLEGHFRRMAGPALVLPTQDVGVQVAPNLHSAIRVVAPTLAPLAQIAEELATRIPSVQPAADFRSELHRALEVAHRQQSEQRGAAQPGIQRGSWLALAAGLIVGLGLGGIALWLVRRRVR